MRSSLQRIVLFCALALQIAGYASFGGRGLVTSSAPFNLSGAAASAIAGDMVTKLAEQVGPVSGTIILKPDGSPFGQALETSLKSWGYAVATNQKTAADKTIPLAYVIQAYDGQVLARLSTGSVELGRAYTATAAGAFASQPALRHATQREESSSMTQSLKLGGSGAGDEGRRIRRLNGLPIIIAVALVIVFFAVIFYGLTSRGSSFRRETGIDIASSNPASTYADQLKRGISNGIIGDQQDAHFFQPAPQQPDTPKPANNPFAGRQQTEARANSQLGRKSCGGRVSIARRMNNICAKGKRERMARVQANDAAYDSPLTINISKLQSTTGDGK
jgi:hypothetical protein